MAYGDGEMDRPVILMHANIRPFTQKGDGKTAVKLCEDPDVKKIILADLQSIAKAKLPVNAKVCDVHLIPGCEDEKLMWTPDNGPTKWNVLADIVTILNTFSRYN